MASDRARELERLFKLRRGHAPQISISDDNHHVTEAIGDMYGDSSDNESAGRRSSRPLSFLPSPNGDSIQPLPDFEPFDPFPTTPPARSPLRPSATTLAPSSSPPNGVPIASKKPPSQTSSGRASPHGQLSPPLSRTPSDTASQQFPLNDLEYESSPAGLAQELSNLQAIRRMSMGVNNADPDLPSFKSPSSPPASPPPFDDDDTAKLFWVPARLHPELAPKEFKTFIEEKVDKIRRRSGDSDSLSPDGMLGRQASGAGLRRKKSMLSRQIDSGSGYRDGADRLERKRSGSHSNGLANLSELEHIVEDPSALIRRMSIDSKGSATDGEVGADSDVRIIPGKPGPTAALKRSTRTTYRRGSLRKGGPALSRRLGGRQAETDTEESPSTSPTLPSTPEVPPLPLTRVQSEPVIPRDPPSNFSRPQRRRSPPALDQRPGSSEAVDTLSSVSTADAGRPQQRSFHSRIASNGRTTAPLPGYTPQQVPQIIETPPQESDRRPPIQLPERLSSRQPPPRQPQPPLQQASQPVTTGRYLPHGQSPHAPPNNRTPPPNQVNRQPQPQISPIKPAQTFDDLVQNPAPIPGNNTRVDNLSIIPNIPEDKKAEKKTKDKKDEGGTRKTSWNWFAGGDKEKEREKKEREKEEREREMAKKVKNKLSKPADKAHDETRLDVLHASMHSTPRGRESVVLDRESIKLEEERKKESNRKSSSESTKKEKEPGLLSSIFGGSKKKSDKESSSHKKLSARGLSPDPPPRILKPDIDYNWTRFSILEERAIYRMAHIKLANPRRELYSQVLLSNFMYSYLAKVQQMHPQIQIGNSKQAQQAQQAQQRQQQAALQKKETHSHGQPGQSQGQGQNPAQGQGGQSDEFMQYQRYQKQQQQEQTEKTNEWPGPGAQQQSQQAHHQHNHQPQQNGHVHTYQHTPHQPQLKHDPHGQNAYQNQNPRDSHHSMYSNGSGGGGAVNAVSGGGMGGGYSVANSQNYLGQAGGMGYRAEGDHGGRRGDDDMW